MKSDICLCILADSFDEWKALNEYCIGENEGHEPERQDRSEGCRRKGVRVEEVEPVPVEPVKRSEQEEGRDTGVLDGVGQDGLQELIEGSFSLVNFSI